MRLDGVRAEADDLDFAEPGACVAELASLDGSPRRAVLRIAEQDGLFSKEVLARPNFPVLIL